MLCSFSGCGVPVRIKGILSPPSRILSPGACAWIAFRATFDGVTVVQVISCCELETPKRTTGVKMKLIEFVRQEVNVNVSQGAAALIEGAYVRATMTVNSSI